MLPSSVRRVVATASPSLTSTTTRAATATGCFALSNRPNGHQRRFSSSKPSSPDNGSKDIAQSIPAAKASESKTAAGEKRKRRAKDASAQAKQLPSVPSTQHLSPEALGLSTFFSLHRPISVTHTFPKTVSDDAFASIFTPSSPSQVIADVTSRLSAAVQDLEDPMGKMSLNNSSHEDENATRIDFKLPDGSESAVYVQLNSMSGQFLPFSPPPVPGAQRGGSAASAAIQAAEDMEGDMPSHRVYKAILTIEETTDENGQVKVVAHSPQLIEEGSEEADAAVPRTFLERMALRQLRYDEARGRRLEEMHAISVKRQKKLKMKKKKYKKLMRRTRNERRKLDRI
ncbi:hypothetical protein GE09DRAFT_1241661 [Coniochaeta sp. 2T2.1]|nr:hypothetical protein GE09DRAFT_1241661 [Coniochaeta sp. 2T2.1]